MECIETPCTSFFDDDGVKVNKEKKNKKPEENKMDPQNLETVSFRRYVLYPIENRNFMYVEENEDSKGEKEKIQNTLETEETLLNGYLENAARLFLFIIL